MKLKNKKTGEIIEFDAILPVKDVSGDSVAHLEYGSLAELNEEWEDAPEEPKGYWFISTTGKPHIFEGEDEIYTPGRKQIGNYFETKEEAEKAVEKLKAWKRIKDKGFRFTAWYGGSKNISYEITSLENETYIPRQICDDLDFLFGGEE